LLTTALGFVQIFYYGVWHWGKIKVTLERKGFCLSSGICVILTAYLLYCKGLESIAREFPCKYVVKNGI